MTTDAHDITVARLRSKVYSLLSDGLGPVNDEVFGSFKSGYIETWREIARAIEGGEAFIPHIDKLEKVIASTAQEGLVAEHSMLFEPRSKLQVPPYETEYTLDVTPQHALSQPAHLADIAGFYNAFGLTISEEMPDRADSIVTELEFMCYMAHKESVAIEAQETEHIEIVRDAEKKFLDDHLGCWTAQFRDRMATADSLGFYISVAELLDLWVSNDKAYFGS